jgi:hypothetical protein
MNIKLAASLESINGKQCFRVLDDRRVTQESPSESLPTVEYVSLLGQQVQIKSIVVFDLLLLDTSFMYSVKEIDLSEYLGLSGKQIIVYTTRSFDYVHVRESLAYIEGGMEMEIGNGYAVEFPPGGQKWVYTTKSSFPLGENV